MRFGLSGCSGTCPELRRHRFWANSFCAQGPRSEQTHRAAGRARSKAEFISKMGIVVEEADETVFWIECLIESGIVKPDLLADLLSEANELVAIFAASQRTAKR
ncbi:MAG TPA: four helix bundle protein [Terriglobales bacterium]|nr:four helix bundle protein [Terriglobales bacterium]